MALSDLALRILIGAEDRSGPAVKSARKGVQSISDQLQKAETIARRFLDLRIFAGFAQDGIRLSDTYKSLTGQLKQVHDETAGLANAQENLFSVAQRTQTGYADTVKLYVRSATALENLANGQEKAAKLTELVNLSFKAQSSSASEISSTVTQLTQAIASGAVQWEDFGSLADTNLLLVSTAVKNLGYNDIGALKQAMSEGQVSSRQLIDALLKGFDEIQDKANQVPTTVEQAWTQLNNALLKFVGESEAANSATGKLSASIQFLANNLEPLVNIATILAELYAVKLFAGLTKTAKGWIDNAIAARQAAIAAEQEALAQQAQLQVKAQLAAIQVKVAAGAIEEARLQKALAVTEQQRTQAVNALTAAITRYKAASAGATAANAALNASSAKAAAGVGLLSKAAAGLNAIFSAWIAWDIGTTIGEWARQFEIVRIAGTYLAQTLVLIQTGLEGMLNGISLGDRWEQIKQINAEFDAIRENSTAKAQQAADAEKNLADAKQQAQQQAVASLAEAEKAYESFFTHLDALYQYDQQAVSQRERQKISDIEAGVGSEQSRARRITDVIIQANQERLRLARNYADEHIRIIDQIYNAELERARANGTAVARIEQQANQKKLDVLKTLEQSTKSAIDKMIAEEQRHANRARELADERANAAKSAEERIFAFLREGMDNYDKAYSLEEEEALNLSRLKEAIAKGDLKTQRDVAKRLMDLALERGRVERQLAEGTNEYYDSAAEEAVKRFNFAQNALQNALKGMQGVEVSAATKARAAAKQAQQELAGVVNQIAELQGKIAASTQGQHIVVDNVDEVLQRIHSLDGQNTHSTHTITEVVEQARRFGGMIHAFRTGGKLPGFGGGDIVPAMMEPGEFVIRKEAVAKYGPNLFEKLNAMNVNVGDVIKRRFGGIIPGYKEGGEITVPIDNSNAAVKKYRKKSQEINDSFAEAMKSIREDLEKTTKQYQDSLKSAAKQNEETANSIQQTFAAAADNIRRSHADTLRGIEDSTRNIQREGKTDAEIYRDTQRQVADLQQQAQAALKSGDLEAAQRLQQGIVKLAGELGRAVEDSDGNVVVNQQQAEKTAIDILENTKALSEQIADKQLAAAEQQRQQQEAQQAAQHAQMVKNINAEHQQRMADLAKQQSQERKNAAEALREALKIVQPKMIIKTGQTGTVFPTTIRLFNSGGDVPGVGNEDNVPAMLTPGEWVINKLSVAKYGPKFIDAINKGTLPKFASGGPVGSMPSIPDGKSVTIEFKSQNGSSVKAQVSNESDVNQLLDIIHQSGGVTA